MPNAILVGHSYIARLDAARILHPDIPCDFNLKGCSISFIAKGCARINTIRNLTETISRRQPHFIFLQIGGNDIQANMHNGIYMHMYMDTYASRVNKLLQHATNKTQASSDGSSEGCRQTSSTRCELGVHHADCPFRPELRRRPHCSCDRRRDGDGDDIHRRHHQRDSRGSSVTGHRGTVGSDQWRCG